MNIKTPLYNRTIFILFALFLNACGTNSTKNIAQKWKIQEIDTTDDTILLQFIPQMIPDVKLFIDRLPDMFKEQQQSMKVDKFRLTIFDFRENGKFIFKVGKKDVKIMNSGTWKIKTDKLFLEGKDKKGLEFEIKSLQENEMIISAKMNFQEITFTFIPIAENE